MSLRLLIRDNPRRSLALVTPLHALVLHDCSTSSPLNGISLDPASAPTVSNVASTTTAFCRVEFAALTDIDLTNFRLLPAANAFGTLGLISVAGDLFLVVVHAVTCVATLRPGETVQRINDVGFYCLTNTSYDVLPNDQPAPYHADVLDDEDWPEPGVSFHRGPSPLEHPCLALKKLLSGGTFYYSANFDLTRRLQYRAAVSANISTNSPDPCFLWNAFMIQPLLNFRSGLSLHSKIALDASCILISVIRGFALTITIPQSSAPLHSMVSGMPSATTLISRLSCRRAGTRFNSRGMDDDGNVANFVETETIYWAPSGVCFSYVQIRGSVPIFWEQQAGLLPGQQKITVTRSPDATQPAFDKHFESLVLSYGGIHIINLLSHDKLGEVELSQKFQDHVNRSPLKYGRDKGNGSHVDLRLTEYDFHAQTRGPSGYEAASMIARWIEESVEAFSYYLEEMDEQARAFGHEYADLSPASIKKQQGIFRTNCLDCLDRTNLVQTIISKMAFELCLGQKSLVADQGFWIRHSSMWADNGDALSRIYAGTGALKSSFTRHGKMTIAGTLADARKSATRMYINNFADKGRQNTIDMLLGRLPGQVPVHIFDPFDHFIVAELSRRTAEYMKTEMINILVGTFNLNGGTSGMNNDLSSWLCPDVKSDQQCPEIVAVGFQEIVQLSPQQIVSSDPDRREAWEKAVKRCLNENAKKHGKEEYVVLRGGQLVGASLSIFVRADHIKHIKNVEGSLKKTGLSGMAGNKGAVAIRFEYANTSICLVTAHLAAGFANYEERNRDYKTISRGLRFSLNRSIDDHDTVIWFGDFNYRIGLANETVQKLCQVGDLKTLFESDQLNLQMVAGLAFSYYSEAHITFPPTYKYDLNSDRYDTSDKARIPAWCDRVLCKGDNIRQTHYGAAPLFFSDHRPVYATFELVTKRIDEGKKNALKHILGQQIISEDVETRATSFLDDEEEAAYDDLLGYDSIAPGLPPASSFKSKWWLENSLPVKVHAQPPTNSHLLNPKRPSNPFTTNPEPDWIDSNKGSSK